MDARLPRLEVKVRLMVLGFECQADEISRILGVESSAGWRKGESGLPKWFTLSDGVQRGEVDVTLTYYPAPLVGPAGIATVTIRGHGQRRQEVVVPLKGREPQTVKPYSGVGPIPYPSYEVLTANGVTEVIEHRRMEPLFYLTDDPEVKRQLGVQ